MTTRSMRVVWGALFLSQLMIAVSARLLRDELGQRTRHGHTLSFDEDGERTSRSGAAEQLAMERTYPSPFDEAPPVIYNRDIGYLDYVRSIDELKRVCSRRYIPSFDTVTPHFAASQRGTYVDFAVTFVAQPTKRTCTPPCLIDTNAVGALFHPFDSAPFLDLLSSAITTVIGQDPSAAPFYVRPCGLMEVKFSFVCPPPTPRQSTGRTKQLRLASMHRDKAEASMWRASLERMNYMQHYRVTATVYGYSVEEFVDVEVLSQAVQEYINGALSEKHGTNFNCRYAVHVESRPSNPAASQRTVVYRSKIVHATLQPDGYDCPGDFYTDEFGEPQMYGPTIDVYEDDKVIFEISNSGSIPQSTHFHGLLFRHPYNFNDGPVGTSMGAMENDSRPYNYTLIASPPGTTWYHGHLGAGLMNGNRGRIVIRKRPCTDPYAAFYDEDVFLTLNSAGPWLLDVSGPQVRALRHFSGVEDQENMMGAEASWAYPFNPLAPIQHNIFTSAGLRPVGVQPWAGVYINGIGRGIPLNYSSARGEYTAESWGEARGEYFQLKIQAGKTYRLRLLNAGGDLGFRVWLEGHIMTIISVQGEDVQPIDIQPKPKEADFFHNGIELQPSDRFDVLVTFDQPPGVYSLRVDSLDGCYKDLGMLVYEGVEVTPGIVTEADAVKRDRRCDSDCYELAAENSRQCDLYKQFSPELNLTDVRSIELNGAPPSNPAGRQAAYVIKFEKYNFAINKQLVPVIVPPIYIQHYQQNRIMAPAVHNFIAQYSFAQNEVVDWCIIGHPKMRHPMHLHANRFWVLGVGYGNLSVCQSFKKYDETKPTFHTDLVNTPYPLSKTEPGWVKIRAAIRDVGAWPFHCHLEYHLYKGLFLPVVIGEEQSWPTYPVDLPSSNYTTY